MTRFARSKGSKSSNERIPESATPWSVISQQLQQKSSTNNNVSKAEFEAQRKANYENFLKEEAIKKTTNSWCEFPNQSIESNNKSPKEKEVKKKKKRKLENTNNDENIEEDQAAPSIEKKRKRKKAKKEKEVSDTEENFDVDDPELSKWCDEYSDEEINSQYQKLTDQLEVLCTKHDKKKINSSPSLQDTLTKKEKKKRETTETIAEENPTTAATKDSKKKKKKLRTNSNIEGIDMKDIKNSEEIVIPKKKKKTKDNIEGIQGDIQENKKSEESVIPKKKKKTKDNIEGIQGDIQENKKSEESVIPKKKKKDRKSNATINEANNKTSEKVHIDKTSMKKSKAGDQKTRRKPLPDNMYIVVNGEKVEVANIHGFPVTSKDAERILQLRKSLISKGIPRSEVERTIKLERRRAEKALARLKKNLCFHCRKGGHLLSECPEMNKNKSETTMPVSGLCFKCGSTEHTHFNCKVVRTQDYKFAQCFICKEQGHISRQCPDNPKGIYPKGGACRVCGDVTHLRKDCPKVMQENDKNAITLGTLADDNIEDIGSSTTPSTQIKTTRPGAKHVKF